LIFLIDFSFTFAALTYIHPWKYQQAVRGEMLGMKNCFYFLAFVWTISSSAAQHRTLPFRSLTTNMGLSHGDVFCIYQDHEGYIWIGTTDGLNKYDGIGFTVYKYNQDDSTSLSSSYINALYEDKQNNLWIGGLNGLCKYNREMNNFERIPYADAQGEIFHEHVHAIFEDNTNTLWIGTESGIYILNREQKKLTTRFDETSNREVKTYCNDICQDKNGFLWFALLDKLQGGVIKYHPSKKTFTKYTTQSPTLTLKDNMVICIMADNQNKIWIGYQYNGIDVLDEQVPSLTHYESVPHNPSSLNNNTIFSMVQDHNNKIFVGTNGGGINEFDSSTKVFYHHTSSESENALLSDVIQKLYIDREGILWVGGWGGGVNLYDQRYDRFTLYRHGKQDDKSLSGASVTCFAQDGKGRIWISTDGGGINLFDRGKNSFLRYQGESKNQQSLTNDKVLALASDSHNGLWAGMWQGGLNYFKIEGEKLVIKKKYNFLNKNDVNSNCVFTLSLNTSGEVWVGNYSTGAYKLDPVTDTFLPISFPPGITSYSTIRDILSDSRNDTWFATEYNGLIRWNHATGTFDRFVHHDHDSTSLINNSVNVVFEDSKKRLWVGIDEGGLNLLNRATNSFSHFTTKQGLPDNTIVGILEDERGNLWISSHVGLSKATMDSSNGQLNLTFRNYSAQDGLQGKVFNRWAFLKSQTGEMFFGGLNGFNVFHPDSIKDNTLQPPVHITDFLLFNKPVMIGAKNSLLKKHISQTEHLVLQYDQNIFTFKFIALNYIYSENNQYAYMMEGLEKEWNYVGNKMEATYTNLDPGAYVFRVKGSNNDGIWNEAGASLNITITPPFWETAWFRVLGIILFIGVLISGYKIRTARIRAHNRELQQHVQERTVQYETVNKELEAFTYSVSHDLRAPLRAISGYTNTIVEDYGALLDDEGKRVCAVIFKQTQKMSRLIDDLLSFSRTSHGVLQASQIQMEPMVFSVFQEITTPESRERIDFQVSSLPPAVGDETMIHQVWVNLLSNAVKFSSKKERPVIEVDAQRDGQRIIYSVRDNGAGFDMQYADKLFGVFQRLHSEKEFEGTGVGLAIVQRLIHRHGGKIWAGSQPQQGATFYFTLSEKGEES
jgi:signal transduction histidine kinase/ligand-binding sensor domain-containing protein